MLSAQTLTLSLKTRDMRASASAGEATPALMASAAAKTPIGADQSPPFEARVVAMAALA